ncbi:MAG: CehA/McbA family metallohydrolase [Planctomycetota bacterium]|nr:MAG: CehA/McbA family metallohydrolase [Planctomycetota bacterium]
METKFRLLAVGVVSIVLSGLLNSCSGSNHDRVFFGNLHSHTSYSDGTGTPEDAYRYARHTAHLDFLAITEHNHRRAENGAGERRDGVLIATNHALYTDRLIPAAAQWSEDGSFVALYGQEFSSISRGNHINVYDIGRVIDVANGEFEALIEWLGVNLSTTGQPALIQLNHPTQFGDASQEYGADDFGSDANWLGAMDAQAQLIEILNGPSTTRGSGVRPAEMAEREYLRYLQIGFHVGPTGNQDNHYFTWGTATNARTGVIARELTKSGIYDALNARHVYASEDRNLRVIFRVNDHLCGDRIEAPPPGTELTIEFTIMDDDEPEAIYDIEVYSGEIGGAIAESTETYTVEGNTEANSEYTIEDIHYNGGFQYIFFKVTQPAEHGHSDRVWTAPIWLEPAGVQPPVPPEEDSSRFVASRRSRIYHVSPDCSDAKRIKTANRITGPDARINRSRHETCPR